MNFTDILPLKRPLVSLDLETTGITFSTDRIVQIGICKQHPDGHYTEWETLVRPGIPIPLEASAVHFIDDIRVNTCCGCGGVLAGNNNVSVIDYREGDAVKVKETVYGTCHCPEFKPWPLFHEISMKLVKGLEGCDICGYNVAAFDVRMLAAEFARANIVWPPPKLVDGFRIWQRVAPRNLRSAVRDYLEEDLVDAHSALADARASMRLIPKLLERHPELPRSVDELHAMFFERPRDSNSLDPDGKLIWKDQDAALSFGKHNGKTLKQILSVDRGYLEWMVGAGDFSPVVKNILKKALVGDLPRRQS